MVANECGRILQDSISQEPGPMVPLNPASTEVETGNYINTNQSNVAPGAGSFTSEASRVALAIIQQN